MRGILSAVAEGSRRAGSDVADELARLTVPADPVDEGFLESMAETLSRSALPLWLLLDDAHVLALAPRSTRWGESWISWVTGSGRFSPADGVRRSPSRDGCSKASWSRYGRIGWPLTRPRRLTCLQPIASCSTTVIWRLSSTEPRGGRPDCGLLRSPCPTRTIPAVRRDLLGDRRPVADYLVSEVLRGLGADIHDFMLATSTLTELTVEAAATLSGRSNAGAILERLSRANVLTTRTDTSPPVPLSRLAAQLPVSRVRRSEPGCLPRVARSRR